jgi:hypothetical protein
MIKPVPGQKREEFRFDEPVNRGFVLASGALLAVILATRLFTLMG